MAPRDLNESDIGTTSLCGANIFDGGISEVKAFAERAVLKQFDIKIFDNVGLHEGLTPIKRIRNLLQFSLKSNFDLLKFALQDSTFMAERIIGQGKLDSNGLTPKYMIEVQNYVVEKIIKVNSDQQDPVEGYHYFGNKEFGKALGLLCKTNPFFACALTATDDDKYFELKAYSSESPSDNEPLYLSLMREMKDPSHWINIKFNRDMSIHNITVYEQDGTSKTISSTDTENIDYFASGVIYNLTYFASAIHATIHYLHYLMTAGIVASTDHNKAFSAWADPYDNNIAIKFVEVAALLFEATQNGKPFPSAEAQDAKLVTGKNGLGGTKEVLPKVREVICGWGKCKTTSDYMNTFIFKDLRATSKNPEQLIKEAGLLAEFKKHIANVDSFAEDMSNAMKKHNVSDFELAEEKLKSFTGGLGDGVSEIDTISSWLKLMSCTGLTHGCTLSYTRGTLIPEIGRWRNIKSPTWDIHDSSLINLGTGTIQGMAPDRHVFSNEMPGWNTRSMSDEMKGVLLKYNTIAEDLKVQYQNEIRILPDFKEFGWIKTDFCPDGFDGKQATITTYI